MEFDLSKQAIAKIWCDEASRSKQQLEAFSRQQLRWKSVFSGAEKGRDRTNTPETSFQGTCLFTCASGVKVRSTESELGSEGLQTAESLTSVHLNDLKELLWINLEAVVRLWHQTPCGGGSLGTTCHRRSEETTWAEEAVVRRVVGGQTNRGSFTPTCPTSCSPSATDMESSKKRSSSSDRKCLTRGATK